MDWLIHVDWQELLVPDKSLLETFLRGSVMYVTLLCLLRFVLKRQAGAIGMTDLLVIVLIADAAQNAMAGDYNSLPDGLLLVLTILFWNVMLEWLSYRHPAFERIISPPPLPLIRNGRMIRRNMRHELITEEDLKSQLRLQGIEHFSQVKMACMEGDGKISIIAYRRKPRAQKRSSHNPAA